MKRRKRHGRKAANRGTPSKLLFHYLTIRKSNIRESKRRTFLCVVCGKKHISTEDIYSGLPKIPDTLISKKDHSQKYYLQCYIHNISR